MIKKLNVLLVTVLLSTGLHAEECKHSLTSTCLGLADKTQEAALGAVTTVVDWIPKVNLQDYINEETKNTKAFEYGEYLGAAVGFIGGFEGGTKFMFEAWKLNLANKAKQLQAEAKQLAKEAKESQLRAEESRIRAEESRVRTEALQKAVAKSEAARNARNLDKLRLETDRLRLQKQKRDAGLVHSEGTTDSKLTKED